MLVNRRLRFYKSVHFVGRLAYRHVSACWLVDFRFPQIRFTCRRYVEVVVMPRDSGRSCGEDGHVSEQMDNVPIQHTHAVSLIGLVAMLAIAMIKE